MMNIEHICTNNSGILFRILVLWLADLSKVYKQLSISNAENIKLRNEVIKLKNNILHRNQDISSIQVPMTELNLQSHICDFYTFKLTKTESHILLYQLRGKSAQEIANILSRSIRTIEKHIENIKYKFNCKTRNELLEKSIELGLIELIPGMYFVMQGMT